MIQSGNWVHVLTEVEDGQPLPPEACFALPPPFLLHFFEIDEL